MRGGARQIGSLDCFFYPDLQRYF